MLGDNTNRCGDVYTTSGVWLCRESDDSTLPTAVTRRCTLVSAHPGACEIELPSGQPMKGLVRA